MKQPGSQLDHVGQTYLLVEGGYNDDTRTVTLLAPPENPAFVREMPTQPVTWRDQGQWYPIARRAMGLITMQESSYEPSRPLVEEIFERYLAEHPPEPERAWAVLGKTGYASTLENIIPMGLAVAVYDDEQAAEEVNGPRSVVPIRNLALFLTHVAREGYAGAMWNGEQPVFFCIDEQNELQFLRVRQGASTTVEMEILDPTQGWQLYEGAEEIEFLDNREACDARLVEALGQCALLDWPEDGHLLSVGPREGTPGLVTNEEDGVDYAMLFTGDDIAESWRQDLEEGWVVFDVPDLRHFLQAEALHDTGGGLLNPGEHRARSGVLWSDGERVVLDTFSGFWEVDDDEFTPLE